MSLTREQIRASLSDEQALAACLYGEARGESLEGIVAVGCVIRNRALTPAWWGVGYRSVCLKRDQFSCFWGDDKNTSETYEVAEALLLGGPSGERTVLSEIRFIAAGIIGEQLRDITRNADHYLTATLYRRPECPNWAKGKVPVARIASHCFFRLEL